MDENKKELLKKLRKITVDEPEYGYKLDMKKIQKWITETIKILPEEDYYIKKVLEKLSVHLKNGEVIQSYFYYQVEFIFGGGKF